MRTWNRDDKIGTLENISEIMLEIANEKDRTPEQMFALGHVAAIIDKEIRQEIMKK